MEAIFGVVAGLQDYIPVWFDGEGADDAVEERVWVGWVAGWVWVQD
jgi:hypothetical protein